MVGDHAGLKREKKMQLFYPMLRAKYYRLLKNIDEYLDVVAAKMGKTRGDVLKLAGVEFENGRVRDDITLSELSKLEALDFGSLIHVTDEWKGQLNTSRQSILTLKDKNMGIDRGISKELFQDLVDINANWKIVKSFDVEGSPFYVTFAIPQKIADKHGLEYNTKWWEAKSGFVLTDDGFVVRMYERQTYNAVVIVRTMFGPGIKTVKSCYLSNIQSTNYLTSDSFIASIKETAHKRLYIEELREIKEEAYAATYVSTGDKILADVVSGGNGSTPKHKNAGSVRTSRVIQMVENRTRLAMESAFRRLGISENPEEFVVGTLIEMTNMIMEKTKEEGAQMNPKLLTLVQDNVDKLSDFLAMKAEHRMITTERSIELGEGDRMLIAKEIERRRGGDSTAAIPAEVEIVEAEEVDNG